MGQRLCASAGAAALSVWKLPRCAVETSRLPANRVSEFPDLGSAFAFYEASQLLLREKNRGRFSGKLQPEENVGNTQRNGAKAR